MRSAIETIFQLASTREREKLEATIRRYGTELEGRGIKSVRMRRDNVVKMPPKKASPQKMLRKTG